MKQYCRYCTLCVYGDAVYCSKKEKTMSEEKAKRVNNCKDFDFNEIDVFNPERIYKPRKKVDVEKRIYQEKLF